MSNPQLWNWPDSFDALRAAPQYHALLFENESVRVLDTTVPPGHTVPLHTHRWPSVVYILSWSDFVRRDGDGAILVDGCELEKPPKENAAAWSEPFPPHSFENVGQSEFRAISFELKSP